MLTSQPNLVIDSSVHASLRSHVNSDHMKRAINFFDWKSALKNLDANDAVTA